MILLDTNVLCEPWRPAPNAAVMAWLDEQVAETLYVSSITVAEVCFGVASLPRGKRRNALSAALEGTLEVFGSRVVAFDETAARHYGELAAKARAAGKGFPCQTDTSQQLRPRAASAWPRATQRRSRQPE